MKKILYAILAMFMLTACLYSQEDTVHRASDKALLFSFQGFNLGGGAGGKYWLNGNYALRVTGTLSYSDQENHNTLIYPYSYNPDTRLYSITLGAGIECHFAPAHVLSPYAGFVANVGWTQENDRYNYLDSATENVYNSRSIGGSLLVGIEYRVTSSISLAGEQTLGVQYSTHTGGNDYSYLTFRTATSTVMLLIYL